MKYYMSHTINIQQRCSDKNNQQFCDDIDFLTILNIDTGKKLLMRNFPHFTIDTVSRTGEVRE